MKQKILIRSTNWIGDAIMTTPAIATLKSAIPNSEIHIIAKPWVAELFLNNPNIDKIISYDRDGKYKKIGNRIKFLMELRKSLM